MSGRVHSCILVLDLCIIMYDRARGDHIGGASDMPGGWYSAGNIPGKNGGIPRENGDIPDGIFYSAISTLKKERGRMRRGLSPVFFSF